MKGMYFVFIQKLKTTYKYISKKRLEVVKYRLSAGEVLVCSGVNGIQDGIISITIDIDEKTID